MPDRKNVLFWLRMALDDGDYLVNIPYSIAKSIYEILKEQEPVEPDGENCGECGYTLHRINYDGPDKELRHEWFRFCPVCGKAVKWDE